MDSNPLISLRNIEKYYAIENQSWRVLNQINLDIYAGDMTAITGASGSGKSTLMQIIGLLDNDYAGTYELNTQAVHHLTADRLAILRNQTLGFVFQQFHLLPRFSALQNVLLPLTYREISRKEAEKAACEALNMVNMHSFIHHKPHQLSGGQQQRIAIARALVTQPDIILADEPTGSLDSRTSQEIMDIFQTLHAQGKTILLITHDPHIAQQCKNHIALRDGQIVGAISP